jgi:protein-S-isoprenylcysteine O-methyltransferase Ste14
MVAHGSAWFHEPQCLWLVAHDRGSACQPNAITGGPYAISRNPMHLGLTAVYLGAAVLAQLRGFVPDLGNRAIAPRQVLVLQRI